MNLIEISQYIIVAILGWILGSFVNYLADVLPNKRRLVSPFCAECDKQQNYVNYFLWPRNCPTCGHKRERRTWWVEFIFMTVSLWLWIEQPSVLNFVIGLVFAFGVVSDYWSDTI